MFGTSQIRKIGSEIKIYFKVSLVLGNKGRHNNTIIGKKTAVKCRLKANPIAKAKGINFLLSP
jgi:hypothetical protein